MQITGNGLQKAEIQEINLESFNNNVTILDDHLNDTDNHVNAEKIAKIAEPNELSQIDSTDTNSTMWGKIKKSISEIQTHEDKVASATTLGHLKIGTGLQMVDGTANVKIANDLETNDSETALSAAMGVELKKNAVKVTSMQIVTGNLSPGDQSVVLNFPKGAKEILGVLVNGWQPATSWDTKIYVKSIAINTNACIMYIEGNRTQSYDLRYMVFYK